MNEYRIYKPYQSKGAATKFQPVLKDKPGKDKDGKAVVYKKLYLFMVSAQEVPSDNENAAFAWEDPAKRTIVQLGDVDISDFLLVLKGGKGGLGKQKGEEWSGLFHKTPKSHAIIKLYWKDDTTLNLNVSVKHGSNEAVRVNHTITCGEAMILRILLEQYLITKYHWY